MAGYRAGRINEEVKRELAALIRELKDPRIPDVVSLVSVEVTGDLRYAKAYISVMGGEKERKETAKALNQASGFIRREMAHRVKLRAIPEFIFIADESLEHGATISGLLKEISRSEEKHEQ